MLRNRQTVKILVLFVLAVFQALMPEDLTGKTFYRYVLSDSLETVTTDTLRTFQNVSSYDDDLYRRGTIYRGIRFSGSSSPGIVSGFNLEVKGMISDDMEVSAFISDNNMAVTEEGSTESLSDIDNIYLQFKHPNFMSRMGNFDVRYEKGELGYLTNELSGAYMNIKGAGNSADGYISAGGGEYTSYELTALEGISGPYRIISETSVSKVSSGSETVWLNGIKLERGEDYYFDNMTSELYFRPGTAVHYGDRIVFDCRTVKNGYKNITYGFDNQNSAMENSLNLSFNYYSSSDLKDDPLAFDITQSVKDELERSDNPYIYVSGAVYNEDQGSYDLVMPDSIFVYEGKGSGDYEVRFTRFASGGLYNIEYDSTGTAYFVYDPVNGGNYLPLIKVNAPQAYSRFHGSGEYRSENITFRTEYAASGISTNTFYEDRIIFDGFGDTEELILSFGKSWYGKWKASFGRKYLNEDLILPSRFERVISEEEIDTRAMAKGRKYLRYNGKLFHDLENRYKNSYQYFYAESGSSVREKGHIFNSSIFSNNLYYRADVSYYEAESDSVLKKKKNIYFNPGFSDGIWSVSPYIKVNTAAEIFGSDEEDRKTVKIGSITGYSSNNNSITHSGEYADFKYGSRTYLVRHTNTVRMTNRIGSYLSSEAVWTDVYNDHKDSADTRYDVISCITNFNMENRYRIFAEYSTERNGFYPKVRTYYRVPEGTGDFIYYEGEYFPDDFGNFSYYVSQSDDPIKVSSVKLDVRSFFDFKDTEDDNILYWLSRIDVEQDISIYEKSRSENEAEIMFLNLASFQGDSTVGGTIGSKTSLFFLKKEKLGMDYCFNFKKDMLREFLNYSENKLLNEHNLVLRRTEGDFTSRLSGSTASIKRSGAADTRLDDLTKRYVSYYFRHNFKTDMSYSAEIEYGVENESVRHAESESYRLTTGISAGFNSKGVFRSGLDIIRVDSEGRIPLTMNSGYGKGMSYKWSAAADYSFSRNIFGNMIYNGRLLSYDRRSFHEMKIEIRMEF